LCCLFSVTYWGGISPTLGVDCRAWAKVFKEGPLEFRLSEGACDEMVEAGRAGAGGMEDETYLSEGDFHKENVCQTGKTLSAVEHPCEGNL